MLYGFDSVQAIFNHVVEVIPSFLCFLVFGCGAGDFFVDLHY